MAQVKVCSFAPEQKLAPLIEMLRSEDIVYTLAEDQYGAHLYVDDCDIERVVRLLDQVAQPRASAAPGNAVFKTIEQWPLTFIFVVLGVVGFVIKASDPQGLLLRWLTFTEINLYIRYPTYSNFAETYLQSHQWWRLISPTFLHFGIAHILFNGLALWEVGRRLEYCIRPRWYLSGFLGIAVFANFAQYWAFGPSLFGGLSGVVYGFFGMLPVLHYRTKHPLLALPKGLYIFLGVALMLGPLGIMEKVFGINVADGAHFGGLLCGVILAAVMPLSAMRNLPANRV